MKIPRFWQPPDIEASPNARLEHNDILILPSRFGLFYLALAGVLFVFGSNYQNNLILILSFLMFSLFSSCLLICFRNLSGLSLRFQPGRSSFAGQQAGFPLELASNRARHALTLSLDKGAQQRLPLLAAPGQRLELGRLGKQRGRLLPGLVRVSSHYPLGLCRVWAHIRPQVGCWVWPSPTPPNQPIPALSTPSLSCQWQELDGLCPWQPGHSLSRMDWKQLARQRGRMLKQFNDHNNEAYWLELNPDHGDLEQHLSQLAGAAVHCQQQGIPFGLRGAQVKIAPGVDAHHMRKVLDSLAAVPHGR